MADKTYKVIRAKFKVAESVTLDSVKNKLKGLTGYGELSFGESDVIVEKTINGEVFSRTKPKPVPVEEPVEEKK